ncbi:heptosyltransferase [Pedobacter yulinensis]|uniref:Heptosyltransferase n=1 Tax=Pedobacter yulinensis TaxID=2126353 RepID=A0A2T3HM82_9SPHI|nr:glycosyltransferase family 9 protein [Pedobacter yulinensis]PST83523.1 heptosyltransferase [Pedobacter yulinensis]
MQRPGTLVIFRFSAMGDVAMVASVLREFSAAYPDTKLIMVSREAFASFFSGIRSVQFHGLQPKGKHKGFYGLFKLAKELSTLAPDAVADLHDNIRSRTLSLLLRARGIRICRLNKGRREKAALTRESNKKLVPLKPTTERYADVFRKLGFPFSLSHRLERNPLPLPTGFSLPAGKKLVGIAPFAQHVFKVYPPVSMQAVIAALSARGYQLYVFGGGKEEQEQALAWEKAYPAAVSLIGRFNLSEELAVMSNLDLMLTMDSAGMHMASLCGVPVVSVWGPTHPFAGFLGYGQLLSDCIQPDHPGRPNSIYGNKPCYCGHLSCMELISPEEIVSKIVTKLES